MPILATSRTAVNTSTGTQTFTADLGGATPVGAIVIVTAATTDGTPANDAILSVGVADGTNQACVLSDSENGQSTSDTERNHYSDRVVNICTPGTDTDTATGVFSSFTTDGIVINWTNAPDSAYLLTVILFGGTGVSAKADTVTLGAQDVTATYSSAGLTMNAGFFLMNGLAAGDSNSSARPTFGFIDGDATQKGIGLYFKNNQGTTDNNARLSSINVITEIGAGVEYTVHISNITSSGFDHVTEVNDPAGDQFSFLALELPVSVKAGTISLPAATSSASFTGVGFKPDSLLLLASNMSAVDTDYTDSAAGGIGLVAIDGSSTYSNVITDKDGVGTTVTRSLTDNQIRMLNHDGSTNNVLGTHTSFDTDGFTWNLATSTSGNQWHYLAFGVQTVTAGPSTVALLVDGYQPTLTYSKTVTALPPVKALAIDGYSVTTGKAITASPAAKTLTANGFLPDASAYVPSAMNFAVTRVACDTAGGTQVITADLGGATPKAALFTVTNCTTDGTPANDLIWCYGFTDGTHEHCITYFDENGVTPSKTLRQGFSDRCIQIMNQFGGLTAGVGHISNFTADGVEVTWSTTPTASYLLTTTLFAGDTLQAHVGHLNTGPLVDTPTYSSAGFAFNAGIFATPARTLGAGSTPGQGSIGFCDGDLNQAAIGPFHGNSDNPTLISNTISQHALVVSNPTVLRWTFRVVSITSTGFTHNTTETVGDDVIFLLLKYGKSVKVGITNVPATTGNWSVSGLGFNPSLLLQLTSLCQSVDTTETSTKAGAYGWSVATDVAEYSDAVYSRDNTATSNAKSVSNASLELLNDNGSTAVAGSFSGFSNDGWTYNLTNTTGSKWVYLAFEGEAVVSIPERGNLLLSGYAPTVYDGDKQNLQPPSQSLTETGYTPNVLAGADPKTKVLSAGGIEPEVFPRVNPSGRLILEGYAPTIGVPKIQPLAKELTIIGYVALTAGRRAEPAKGIMEIDGYSPNILYNEFESGAFWRRLPDTRLS